MCFLIWTYTHNPVIYNYKNKSESEKSKEYDRVNQISYQKNVLGNNYNILEMLRFKQADYNHEAKLAKAKSLVNTKKMNGELSNFFACIPYGISNGFVSLFNIFLKNVVTPQLRQITLGNRMQDFHFDYFAYLLAAGKYFITRFFGNWNRFTGNKTIINFGFFRD